MNWKPGRPRPSRHQAAATARFGGSAQPTPTTPTPAPSKPAGKADTKTRAALLAISWLHGDDDQAQELLSNSPDPIRTIADARRILTTAGTDAPDWINANTTIPGTGEP